LIVWSWHTACLEFSYIDICVSLNV